MTALFREFARGLFCLPSGWKTSGDRRLQLSAVLTTLVVLNYITVAAGIRVLLSAYNIVSIIDPIGVPLLIALLIAISLYMRFGVVTDEFFNQVIKIDTCGAEGKVARRRFLTYFTLSILSMLLVLAWVASAAPNS